MAPIIALCNALRYHHNESSTHKIFLKFQSLYYILLIVGFKQAENSLDSIHEGNSILVDSMENLEKLDLAKLKDKLSAEQFEVTQKNGTEQPFKNAYWNNHNPGLYVDVVSGEPLFSSLDKFDSGTGWPSFTRPINHSGIVEKQDYKYGMTRIEVRSGQADSHLGHLFNDGPEPTGKRYCINSASLRFIPVESISEEGYEAYLDTFIKAALVKQSVNDLKE